MSDGLLRIASRVEAAVEAYVSVRDFAKKEAWKTKFEEEQVSAQCSLTRRFDQSALGIGKYRSRSPGRFEGKWQQTISFAPHVGRPPDRSEE
jgi:hypothetical protein